MSNIQRTLSMMPGLSIYQSIKNRAGKQVKGVLHAHVTPVIPPVYQSDHQAKKGVQEIYLTNAVIPGHFTKESHLYTKVKKQSMDIAEAVFPDRIKSYDTFKICSRPASVSNMPWIEMQGPYGTYDIDLFKPENGIPDSCNVILSNGGSQSLWTTGAAIAKKLAEAIAVKIKDKRDDESIRIVIVGKGPAIQHLRYLLATDERFNKKMELILVDRDSKENTYAHMLAAAHVHDYLGAQPYPLLPLRLIPQAFTGKTALVLSMQWSTIKYGLGFLVSHFRGHTPVEQRNRLVKESALELGKFMTSCLNQQDGLDHGYREKGFCAIAMDKHCLGEIESVARGRFENGYRKLSSKQTGSVVGHLGDDYPYQSILFEKSTISGRHQGYFDRKVYIAAIEKIEERSLFNHQIKNMKATVTEVKSNNDGAEIKTDKAGKLFADIAVVMPGIGAKEIKGYKGKKPTPISALVTKITLKGSDPSGSEVPEQLQ